MQARQFVKLRWGETRRVVFHCLVLCLAQRFSFLCPPPFPTNRIRRQNNWLFQGLLVCRVQPGWLLFFLSFLFVNCPVIVNLKEIRGPLESHLHAAKGLFGAVVCSGASGAHLVVCSASECQCSEAIESTEFSARCPACCRCSVRRTALRLGNFLIPCLRGPPLPPANPSPAWLPAHPPKNSHQRNSAPCIDNWHHQSTQTKPNIPGILIFILFLFDSPAIGIPSPP